jgi:transposase InsO family protein
MFDKCLVLKREYMYKNVRSMQIVSQLYMGTGKIGPKLFLCVLMDYDSRMILDYEFGSVNSDRLKQKLCRKAGLDEIPPASRYVSAIFASLAAEEMSRYTYDDNEQRKASASDWIDFYNNKRIHASLNYRTPKEVFAENQKNLG